MTEVKGLVLLTIPLFIKDKFGEEGYNNWLNTLKTEIKDEYDSALLSSEWYSLKDMCIEPEREMCKLFFNGDPKGAWEFGRFNAGYTLKGVYKIFMKIGSPAFLIGKASQVLSTYYRASKLEVKESSRNHLIVNIVEFDEIEDVIESSIAGWMERALEICGCMNIDVKIGKSLAKGDEITEFIVKWNV